MWCTILALIETCSNWNTDDSSANQETYYTYATNEADSEPDESGADQESYNKYAYEASNKGTEDML